MRISRIRGGSPIYQPGFTAEVEGLASLNSDFFLQKMAWVGAFPYGRGSLTNLGGQITAKRF